MGAGYTGEERGGRSATELACDASAGIAVGVIVATFVCPLDVIKTRLQVYGFPAMQTSGSREQACSLHHNDSEHRCRFPACVSLLYQCDSWYSISVCWNFRENTLHNTPRRIAD